MEVACAYEDFTSGMMCAKDASLSPLRERLLQEESRAERLSGDLAEAAAVGQMLVARNEELQHELDALRLQLQRQEQPELADEHSLSPHGHGELNKSLRSTTPGPFRSTTPCRSATPRRAGGSQFRSKMRAKTPVRSHSSHRRHSVHILAKEYDSDMQDLIAENKRLSDKATELKRGHGELRERLEEALAELAAQRVSPAHKALDTAHLNELTEFAIREDALKSELDAERATSWELERQAQLARREAAELRSEVAALVSECHEQQGHAEAQAEETDALHERLQELADLVAARRLEDSARAHAEAEQAAPEPQERSRIETYGRSLAIDIRADLVQGGPDTPISPTDMRLLREVDELRAQLVNAEFALQTREVYRLRGSESRPAGATASAPSRSAGRAARPGPPPAAGGFSALQDVVRDAEERLTRRLSSVRGGWNLLGGGTSPRPAATSPKAAPAPGGRRLSSAAAYGGAGSGPPPRTTARRSSRDEAANSVGGGKFLFRQSWPEAFRSGQAAGQ